MGERKGDQGGEKIRKTGGRKKEKAKSREGRKEIKRMKDEGRKMTFFPKLANIYNNEVRKLDFTKDTLIIKKNNDFFLSLELHSVFIPF